MSSHLLEFEADGDEENEEEEEEEEEEMKAKEVMDVVLKERKAERQFAIVALVLAFIVVVLAMLLCLVYMKYHCSSST